MTLIVDDITMLSGNFVRVPLSDSMTQRVYLFAPYVHVPYVAANFRTQYKVEQIVLPQSPAQHDGFYVANATNALDDLTMHIAIGVLNRSMEQFGFVVSWQAFGSSLISRQIYLHRDASLPRELFVNK
jgi:hypothetical protein